MFSLSSPTLAWSTLVAFGAYVTCRLFHSSSKRTALADLPGPPRPGLLTGMLVGHMGEIFQSGVHFNGDGPLEEWLSTYGRVVRFDGLLGRPHIATTDLRALAHVAAHSDDFHKWPLPQRLFSRTLGGGLFVVEGAEHRRQRRLLNPAFGPTQIRNLSGIFIGKANELCSVWRTVVDSSNGTARVDGLDSLARTTLDIMGLAGFGYAFESLSRPHGSRSGLALAFDVVFKTIQFSAEMLICLLVPAFERVPTPRNQSIAQARATVKTVGLQLLQERKEAVSADEQHIESRDLLSLLVSANTAETENKRISDDDMLAQIPTFLLAGHETSSTTLSWILFELSIHPVLQTRLRTEVRSLLLPESSSISAPLDTDVLSALEKLPLLDAVVRETLRLHAPVRVTLRMATKDTALPLSVPVVDRNGVARSALELREGDLVFMPIYLVNRLKEVYGEDADEWSPDRWLSEANQASLAPTNLGEDHTTHAQVPGVWGNLLTFWAGAHACIGWRFALLETKIVLHALISHFAFTLAVPPSEMSAHTEVVTRPLWLKELEKGPQLPLLVSRAEEDEERVLSENLHPPEKHLYAGAM